MREEVRRRIITAAATTGWALTVVMVALMVTSIAGINLLAVTVTLGVIAGTLTVVRVNISTRSILAQVFRAGQDAEQAMERDRKQRLK